MKMFIRRIAAGLVGAHITGIFAVYVIELDDEELRSYPVADRIVSYLLAPYLLAYIASAEAAGALGKAVRHSAS